MNATQLRFTDTNSADDSHGKTWGLEGNLFWYLAGGAFASVALMLLLFSAYHLGFAAALVLSTAPLGLAAVYVFGFRQGKPPRYDLDCLEYWIAGRGFGPDTHCQMPHPLKNRHV